MPKGNSEVCPTFFICVWFFMILLSLPLPLKFCVMSIYPKKNSCLQDCATSLLQKNSNVMRTCFLILPKTPCGKKGFTSRNKYFTDFILSMQAFLCATSYRAWDGRMFLSVWILMHSISLCDEIWKICLSLLVNISQHSLSAVKTST